MPNVTFYLLIAQRHNSEQFACRLVDKTWQQGLAVHLHLRDEHHCRTVDQLLWQWREDSFIPHETIDISSEPCTSVTLGCRPPQLNHAQLVINLTDDTPDYFQGFSRVCEIVSQTPEDIAISREKFKRYRQSGIEPTVHKLA